MNAIETVQAVLGAIEASEWQRARSLLADDFTFGGAVPQPIGPDAWLGIHRAMSEAMPDFSFNASGFQDENGTVSVQVHPSGTQTRDMQVPLPGLARIPATGKRVALPVEPVRATVRGEKIATMTVTEVPGGGVPGMLAQLGVPFPAHA